MRRKFDRLVMITSLQPATHYSQYLCSELYKFYGNNLEIYAEHDERNKELRDTGIVKPVWRKNFWFFWDILRHIYMKRKGLVHVQHEINMYGGKLTAILFPWLLLVLRLLGLRIVVTIHAVVALNDVDDDFMYSFMARRNPIVSPWSIKLFFAYVYRMIDLFADKIIVHTKRMKGILVNDYGYKDSEIELIYMGVPVLSNTKSQKSKIKKDRGKYLLYFGYLAKRKGLDKLLLGFAKFTMRHPRFKLVLAGGVIPGQEFAKSEVLEAISDCDIEDNVELTGFVNVKQLSTLFNNAYVVLIPGAISISASATLAQSFAYHKCSLVSNIGNFKEEVVNMFDGILVENNKWYKAMDLVVSNPGLVKKIEKNVRLKAKERSWSKVARLHLKIYKQLYE